MPKEPLHKGDVIKCTKVKEKHTQLLFGSLTSSLIISEGSPPLSRRHHFPNLCFYMQTPIYLYFIYVELYILMLEFVTA